MRLAILATLLLSCCAHQTSDSISATGLTLRMAIDSESPPTASVIIANSTKEFVAFSDTLGYEGAYLQIELKTQSGEILRSHRELFEAPSLLCLKPASELHIPINIQRPLRRISGGVNKQDYIYDQLAPGSYSVRVVYKSPADFSKARCKTTFGDSESQWQSFTVRN